MCSVSRGSLIAFEINAYTPYAEVLYSCQMEIDSMELVFFYWSHITLQYTDLESNHG